MKFVTFALVVATLSLTSTVRADPIAGGPRQTFDATYCINYRPVWPEFDLSYAPDTLQFGPEAEVPGFLSSNNATPEQVYGVKLWGVYARLNSAYAGAGVPIIGYDQLYAAFAIAERATFGQTGPRLPMPVPTIGMTGEVLRAYRISQALWAVSFHQLLTLDQLAEMRAVMLQTPTCGGATY